MENELYQRLKSTLSNFPYLYGCLDNKFINKQFKNGITNFLFKHMQNEDSKSVTYNHLPYLEQRLAELSSTNGYNKLCSRLKSAYEWDMYQELVSQIDITLWFKGKNILEEIEPRLPNRDGYADILISFRQNVIYYEVTSQESLFKSIETKGNNTRKLNNILKKNIWMSQQDAENELKIRRLIRKLLDKTNKQLPNDTPGISALDTGKSMDFYHRIKDVAERIFPNRPNIILITLWSLEKGSQIVEAPFCFINSNSAFLSLCNDLLNYLDKKAVVI